MVMITIKINGIEVEQMTAKIPLQNGEYAIVDKEDYENVRNNFFQSSNTKSGDVYVRELGSLILGKVPKTHYIHNKNGNKLDFRKSNLEIRQFKTLFHQRKALPKSKSKYKGVQWRKSRSKWIAVIRVNGKLLYLGSFENEEEAALTYNRAAVTHFGEYAFQNVIGYDNRNDDMYNEDKLTKHNRRLTKRSNKKNKNGYKGVYSPRNSSFTSRIINNGKAIHLGTFDSPEQAAKAYDKKAYELYGDKAILNFPELINEYKKGLKQC